MDDKTTLFLIRLMLLLVMAAMICKACDAQIIIDMSELDPNVIDLNNDGKFNVVDFAWFTNLYQANNGAIPTVKPNEVSLLRMEIAFLQQRIEQLEAQLKAERLDVLALKQWLFQAEEKTRTMFIGEANRLIDATRPVEINWFDDKRLEVVIHRGGASVGVFFDPNEIRKEY